MRVTAFLLLAMVARVTPLQAHGMRTAYLELREGAEGMVMGTWKVTVPARGVAPRLGEDCTPIDAPARDVPSQAHTFTVHCAGGLGGRRIVVEGLGPVLTEAVVRVLRADGTVLSHVVTPDAPAWVVPVAQSWLGVGRDYVRLGVQHILTGADHLLFLLALVLYVRRPRAVFVTESAFTLSHSVSYSATALGWVHVYAPAAEACIALSLVLVALDVGDPDAARRAAWQGPLIALVFGLVHGLGFAGALSEVGLPDHAVASALVGFGIGVEIGQVGFLLAVMVGILLVSRLVPQKILELSGSYLVGVTGMFWLLGRLWVCFA